MRDQPPLRVRASPLERGEVAPLLPADAVRERALSREHADLDGDAELTDGVARQDQGVPDDPEVIADDR